MYHKNCITCIWFLVNIILLLILSCNNICWQVSYNYSALCVVKEREMAEFAKEVASVYSTHRESTSKNYRIVLAQIMDSVNSGGFVNEERFRSFYQFIFGESLDGPTLSRKILEAPSEDLERNHWHNFNCSLDIYKNNMFARDVPW